MSAEQVKPGYKRTEVGVIPIDWEITTIDKATAPDGLVRGPFGGALTKGIFEKTGKKVYEQRNAINRNEAIGEYFISEKKFGELKRFSVVSGDFIVSCSGTIGKIFQIPNGAPEGVINQALLKLRINSTKLDSKFFLYYFDWDKFQKLIIDNTHGGAMPNLVGMSQFRLMKIPRPPLQEQCSIASALSDVDALLAKLDQLIAKKRDLKQATMQQLLTGQTRLPGFSGKWELKRLGDICNLEMGRTPSRINQSYWGQGYKWLSIADLKTKIIRESSEEVTELAAKEMRIVPKGTLLMSFKLSIGRLAFAGCDLFTNEAICSFNNLQANANYLYYALGRVDFSLYGKQAVKGYTLNKASLKTVELSLPPTDEQTAIATALSDLDAELAALEHRRNKTLEVKQGMMQELLTGRIRLI